MLHIHRAARADALADALAGMLAQPPADPFATEVVAVPTRGMERWLTQRMSSTLGARAGHTDGVCANVDFPSPHRLISDAVATAAGVEPAQDPWLPERSAWPLLEAVEAALDEEWLAPLARYLGATADTPDPARRARRLTAVNHVATLFHRYALHRPRMLAAWAAGADVDAAGDPLPIGCAWQAELWRRLRARIGVPGPAERWSDARARLIDEPGLLDLPGRLAAFGLTRLPTGHLEILAALAARRDLHLFLLHPSPQLWARIAGDAPDVRTPPVLARADDPTPQRAHNPLLASWGRDVREAQLVLIRGTHAVAPAADHEHASPSPSGTLLGRIQAAIAANTAPPGPPLPDAPDVRPGLAEGDRTIEVHSCHGRARQVEVMRDAILHALAADPEMEPRDVIVMCPDIETFAPLIEATFGAAETATTAPTAALTGQDHSGAPGPTDLRVRLADRALRQTNPLLGVVAQLLELAEQRLTASQLLDLADRSPVRRRFRLDDDDVTRLQDWIAESGIRWGLDAPHRARYKLQSVDSGTWRAGLDRLLLGVTMTEDDQRLFGDVLPLDDVDSRSIDLAGRFAELVARTADAVRALSTPQPLAHWAQSLSEAADALTATAPRESWQRAELQRVLDEMLAEAGDRPPIDLAPAEVRAFLAARLAGRPTRANFRTGHLTVCTLMPMRSVPHRVVCLLGLDDGAFPRKAPRDGDDLMLSDPLVGERDPRSEDRQLLLDALMAATEKLIITYTGNDERTNAPRPPAVPVGELLDVIDATVTAGDRPARERVLIRHPLQPFDPRNFRPGGVAGAAPWSHDAVGLAGARALTGERSPRPPFLARPLPAKRGDIVELADLVRFLEHPVRAFLRQRLGISLRGGAEEVQDALPVELDGLERWGVGQRLLEARLRGVDERAACLAEIRRGTLPPGALGQPVIRSLFPLVRAIVDEAAKVAKLPPAGVDDDPVDVRADLGDGRLLTGTVSGVRGDVLLTTTFSRVSSKHRIAAWARLVALSATHPDRRYRAATVGRAGGNDDVRVVIAGPLAPATATEQLRLLVDLYDRGMCEALPLFCLASEAYAAAALAGQDPVAAATDVWQTEWGFEREDKDLEHQMAFGGVLTFSEVLQIGTDGAAGGPAATPFHRYARQLWDGPLTHEQVSAR